MISRITNIAELKESVKVLKESFGTVAKEFHLTKKNCPTNSAFIRLIDLEKQFSQGIEFYQLVKNKKQIGFVAIEQSKKNPEVYYIQKLAILPDYRNQGFGRQLMDFIFKRVEELGGLKVSIGIIESNVRLKDWYRKQGFIITEEREFKHLPFKVCFLEKTL